MRSEYIKPVTEIIKAESTATICFQSGVIVEPGEGGETPWVGAKGNGTFDNGVRDFNTAKGNAGRSNYNPWTAWED